MTNKLLCIVRLQNVGISSNVYTYNNKIVVRRRKLEYGK